MSTQPPLSSGPLHSDFASDPEIADLVRVYVDEMPAKVAALKALWQEHQLDGIRRLAHQLKGASPGYGFAPVGDAAERLEHTIEHLASGQNEMSTEHLRQRFDELVRLCGRVAA